MFFTALSVDSHVRRMYCIFVFQSGHRIWKPNMKLKKENGATINKKDSQLE